MYNDYRGRRQPRMLIHQTEGLGPRSHCLLVNLSQDIIHIQCVRAVSIGDFGETSKPLGSDVGLPRQSELGRAELEDTIREGPLKQGEFIRLGSFEEILEQVVGASPAKDQEWLGAEDLSGVQRIELSVVAVFGSSNHSVGASRRFDLYTGEDDNLRVLPVDTYTRQLYRRRDRKLVEKWLKRCQGE